MEANEILIRLFQVSWLLVLSLTPRLNLVGAFTQVGRAPVIRVATGDIEGRRMVLTPPHLVPVYQYLGVPYATPPVGPRRFRPPHTPGPSWEGTKNATTFGPACPQKIQEPAENTPFWKSNVMNQKKPFLQNISEDCLYLNIYVPERDETQSMDPLAVMVHIHGDTYDEGSANMYDGSILASYGGVIVITVNYRLGILGFLSTADSAARGNYGLMDQIAALKWIHQNIAVFGGNPDRITLFGVGSGAACSGLLMFSNHTKGLIAGVIAESGSANAPWALSREPARFAKLLAEHVGCEAETNLQMVECLRGLPYSDLINLDFQSPLYMFAFAPVVDEDVIAADPSIMWGQLIAGERDIGRDDFAYLSGIVRNEAFSYIAEETDVVGRMELEVFDDILDGFVQNNFGGNMKASSVIRDVIYYEYMDWGGGEGNAFTLKDSLQDILTDHQWVAPCISSLKMADEAGIDAWFYMFPHRPRRSIYPRWAGAVHLEEVPYVFGAPVSNVSVGIFTESYSSAEAALSLATMNYWSNFAKSGNPNSPRPQSSTDIHRNFVVEFNFETMEDWPRYTVGRQQMIYLASNPKAKDFYRVHKISLWEQLVSRIEQKFAFEPTVNNNPFLPGPQISNPGGGQVTHSITSAMMPVTSAISPMTDPFETDIDNRVPGADITPSGTESNALETDKQEKKGFLVELSMVIAIGGFLLLLNLIILGAIYYLRDKRKIEKRLAQKYLTSQTEEKKRTSLHPQTTPDSGIGIPVALNLNQQSGHHGSNQRYVTPSVPSRAGTSDHNHGNGGNRDYSSLKYNRSPQHFGAIRRNSAGEVEFEV